MRTVIEFNCLLQNIIPRKTVSMEIDRTGVADKFHSVTERTVCFGIHESVTTVCRFQNLPCIVIVTTAIINFKFHTIISYRIFIAAFVKYRRRLVTVTFYFIAVPDFIITFATIWHFTNMKNIIIVNKAFAFFTTVIMIIIAIFANFDILITYSVSVKGTISAAITFKSFFIITAIANIFIFHHICLIYVNFIAAAITSNHFTHFQIPFYQLHSSTKAYSLRHS